MHGHGEGLLARIMSAIKPKYTPKDGFETNAEIVEKNNQGIEIIDLDD